MTELHEVNRSIAGAQEDLEKEKYKLRVLRWQYLRKEAKKSTASDEEIMKHVHAQQQAYNIPFADWCKYKLHEECYDIELWLHGQGDWRKLCVRWGGIIGPKNPPQECIDLFGENPD